MGKIIVAPFSVVGPTTANSTIPKCYGLIA